jgi:hypothetical protein
LLVAQDAIDGGARGARHRGEVFLGEWHDRTVTRSVAAGEIEQTTPDACVGVDVVGLDEALARPAQLLGEQPQEDVLHAGVALLKANELVPEHGASLTVLEGRDRRRAARLRRKQRELAERFPGTEHVEQHLVAERRQDASTEAAADDEVERVRGIVAMKDHLALGERASTRDRQQLTHILCGQASEQELHGSSLCHLRDIRNVVCANDTKLDDSYARHMSGHHGMEHTMKRLVVAIVVVVATMALAPSVASARISPAHLVPIPVVKTSPIARTSPIVKTSPIVHTSPIALTSPARWSYMWLRAIKVAPAIPYAPMPRVERTAALRISVLRSVILKLHAQAR